MIRSLRFCLIAIAALLTICAFVVPSYADTQGVSASNCAITSSCNGYSFEATLTPTTTNNYSLSYTIKNVSGSAGHPQSSSLTLFGNQYDIGSTFSNFKITENGTSFNNSAGIYNVYIGKSNNSVGGGNCNSSVSGGVCVLGTGALATLNAGDSLKFTFDFTCTGCTELANWNFMSEGTKVNGGGNAYAISQTQAVPEPSTPLLLFCSLLAALGILAIPRVRNILLPAQQSELNSLNRI